MSAASPRLRVATCSPLPEPDADASLLAETLARAGIDAAWAAWDDPAVAWDDGTPVVIRSTWNYAQHLDAFEAWLGRLRGPLWNPAHVVRGNVRKRYLLALAARGVATVPTTLVERGASGGVTLPAGRFVIKPEVGAGSWMTRSFARDSADARAFLAELTATRAALVQPYMASVEAYGERSLVWIDGEISHAVRKSPRFSGEAENTTGPFPIADDERALALAALAPVAGDLLYGRVDLARDASGRPVIMELELVEPSLFLVRQPGAADRLVAALARRLAQG